MDFITVKYTGVLAFPNSWSFNPQPKEADYQNSKKVIKMFA